MEYRLYEEGDEEEIVGLLSQVFDGWPKFDLSQSSLDYWKWKYLDNPYGSIIALCCDNNHIVGCQHILFTKLKVGNTEYHSGIGLDVAIHQNYRGKGEYGRLSNFKKGIENEYDLKFRNYVQSNPNLIKRDREQGNPLFPYNVQHSIRVKDIDSFNKGNKIEKLGLKFLSSVNSLKSLGTTRPKVRHDLEIQEIKKFDERINDFWLRTKKHYMYIFVRDMEYLNWRYCDRRGGMYRIFTVEKNKIILGFIVLRINRYFKDDLKGYIVDFLVDPDCSEASYPLIDFMTDFFDENGVNFTDYYNVNNNITKRLSESGFIRHPEKLHYTFRKESLVEEDYHILLSSNADETHFVYGDHDHI